MKGGTWNTNLETSVALEATAPVAWKALSALEDYPRWNSRTRFGADAKAGKWLIMRVKLFGVWLPVPVKVQQCDEVAGLRWQGGIPGLFVGSHYFILRDNGQLRLVQGEDFSGLLLPLLMPVIKRELMGLYHAFGADFKAYCEHGN